MNVLKKQKATLDRVAVSFHKLHRQSYRKAYPAADFSYGGVTNLTKILAAECLGLVFLFVILAQYDEGWVILNTACKKKQVRSFPRLITCSNACCTLTDG
jgi:hypothetical protein